MNMANLKTMLIKYNPRSIICYPFKISIVAGLLLLATGILYGQVKNDGIARIIPNVESGFANGGWDLDRYQNLETLDAGKSIVVADLQGPGIIKHIHTTRHNPEELFSRGIILEIWFDDAEEPAVKCPLADFFGDGCNGKSENFSTLLIECAP